ncbi:NADPH-Fe(3+) oxidoreductase subunit alpha [Geomonas silvestris]|uniref:NADPH-Fe(3+) oxidoreductase subunit alpha n=1 Tax=Geomonas silvestris TaxID=2740184 RepID=A0A6V8MNY2_9BACT|nr:molybdopterin-dependent oxidoreductase [Geomonas silvestris]GFO61654.1 NADPH-Fe(3+) oxidoreductase subunit alpha [Geomonas silvestris]
MVSLTIDGKSVQVEAGSTILDAAATVGIKIPTLCWLQKVSPTGACRICAVEIEGVDRTMTACNTPVKEGIVVSTDTEKLRTLRRKIMELMLVNHPLDCPVCDAGGECGLQDACYEQGAARQEFSALLERRPIRYDWRLLESDPNRCILCEKCVKVDHEIVGCDAIHVVNKGEATIIDTVDGKPLDCEFCGNCIEACPTGTLISAPFKFKGRVWDFSKVASICAFCGVGCQIDYHVRNGRVGRVTSDDSTFNNGNLCINGRFGYSYLASADRLARPQLRQGGALAPVSWDAALDYAAEKLKAIVAQNGPAAVAGIGSPRVTNEESFLFQKFLREALGTGNIDSEARLGYAPAQAQLLRRFGFSGASACIDQIDNAQAILVFGCDLNAEATGVEYRVIKAATKHDAKLVLANMREVKLRKFSNQHLKHLPGRELFLIQGLMKALVEVGAPLPAGSETLKAELAKLTLAELATASGVTEEQLRVAGKLLAGKERVAIIFGADLMRAADAAAKVTALADLAVLTGAASGNGGGIFPIDAKNNTVGLLDMGGAPDLLPGQQPAASAGKDLWGIVEGIEQGSIKALYLLGSDLAALPENARIRKALAKLELLIVQDIFEGESLSFAHVVLPAAAAAEKSGSFTSTDNRVQVLLKAVNAPGEAKTDLEIIAALYQRLAGTQQPSRAEELAEEIARSAKGYLAQGGQVVKQSATLRSAAIAPLAKASAGELPKYQLLVGPIGYHNGTSSTRSENNLMVSPSGYLELHPADAAALGVADGAVVKVSSAHGALTARAKVSAKLQPGLIFAPVHFRELNANALLKGSCNLVEVKVERG